MGTLKQPSPSTKPTTHPAVVSLSCWFSAPLTLSLLDISPSLETGCDSQTSSGGYTAFPAYSRLRTAASPLRGAAPPACQGASYLRHCCYSPIRLAAGRVVRSFLPDSPCRHEDRTVSSPLCEERSLACSL